MVVARSPISPEEVAPVRQPVDRASMLPRRVFHDADVFAFEQDAWFGASWLCVGREEDAARPGEYLVVDIAGRSVLIVRGEDEVLRAFHNVCRHRGSLICTETSGRMVRIQCPYHAWTYELDGSLRRATHTDELIDFDRDAQGLRPLALETWQGFLFVHLGDDAASLMATLGNLSTHLERYPITGLRSARRMDYEVGADWKVIAENYSECYHCPGVHPQLNRLTPYDRGRNLESDGPWCGGWMELQDDFDTMSVDGLRHGRPPLPGITADDERRIHYFLVWPNLMLSLHPDYVLTHQVWPLAPGRSRVTCRWLFHPDVMDAPGFDPSDAIEFWDLTNRQDWEVCELQQRGTASPGYVPGRYTLMEDMVHAFDLMCADGYAQDGRTTRFAPRHDKWHQPAAVRSLG